MTAECTINVGLHSNFGTFKPYACLSTPPMLAIINGLKRPAMGYRQLVSLGYSGGPP